MGIGGMIVDDSIDLSVTKFGGNGLLSESRFQPDSWPHRHEAGTLALPAIAGLHAAMRWFNEVGKNLASVYGLTSSEEARLLSVPLTQDDWETPLDLDQHAIRTKDTIQHIHRTEMAHLHKIIELLRAFDHVRILGSPDKSDSGSQVATLSFVSSKVATDKIADVLDTDFHVCLRAGLHCAPLVHEDANTLNGGGAVRLAPGFFTDKEDMTQLIDGLNDVLSV